MAKINKNNNDKQKISVLLEQDLRMIKALAGNDKKVRERILKHLKKWFEQRSSKFPFTKDDFIRFWKGLFYTMWMADKPLVQEECAEKIASLVHFSNPQTSLLFFKCGLIVLTTEWFGIDQLRLDKFLMFVRRFLRQAFQVLKDHEWDEELLTEFSNILVETVLKAENTTYLGLTMHITEIYLEELAKVSNGKIKKHLVAELLKPFMQQLSKLNDNRQINHLQKYLFHHLLNQSDEGIEYQAKFKTWKDSGFPGGTIDALEKVSEIDDDESMWDEENIEEGEKPLDPRAGHVDVTLSQLPFDASEISQLLLEHRFSEGSTTKARKAIVNLANQFEKLSKGAFPLGIKEMHMPDNPTYSTSLKKSVNRLVKFENKLLANSNKNRKQKKKRKIDEVIENGSDSELFKDKLEEFIRKSEENVINGHIHKKKKLKLKSEKNVKNMKNKLIKSLHKPIWTYEESFLRNSGLWIVEKFDSDESWSEGDSSLNESSLKNSSNGDIIKTCQQNMTILKKKKSNNGVSSSCYGIKKKRVSLNTSLVKSPLSRHSITPRSEKKVKIDLKLNQSQEIHEHRAQIRNSPAIPFDANKKPLKPLLKPNAIASPINPFYKKKIKLSL